MEKCETGLAVGERQRCHVAIGVGNMTKTRQFTLGIERSKARMRL